MGLRTIARGARRGATLASLGLVGSAVVMTARHALMTPQPLRSGLPGASDMDRRHGGQVFYSMAGALDARPVVLLHDFYPGASNYEFRAIYERLAETYRVYAPDWLGFGMSERPALRLNGEFYAAMLIGFLRDVARQPAIVIARGRAANIAARAAADAPSLFDRLTLVSPDLDAGERLDPTVGQVVARLFQRVSLGLTPYAALSLRPALRLAEGMRSAVGPGQVDDETVDHLYASAHQFGGQHGALALLTGELDLPLQQVFPTLIPPTLVVAGERDRNLPVSRLERLVALNPHADLEVTLAAGATVYQDQPKLFLGTLHRWLGRRVARQAAQVEALTASASGVNGTRPLEPIARAALNAPIAPVAPDASVAPDAPVAPGDTVPAAFAQVAPPMPTAEPIAPIASSPAEPASGAPPTAFPDTGPGVNIVPVLDPPSGLAFDPFDPRDLRDLRDLRAFDALDSNTHIASSWNRRTAPRPPSREEQNDSPTHWWRGSDSRHQKPSDANNHRKKGPKNT